MQVNDAEIEKFKYGSEIKNLFKGKQECAGYLRKRSGKIKIKTMARFRLGNETFKAVSAGKSPKRNNADYVKKAKKA